jgi:hypothetical protein
MIHFDMQQFKLLIPISADLLNAVPVAMRQSVPAKY